MKYECICLFWKLFTHYSFKHNTLLRITIGKFSRLDSKTYVDRFKQTSKYSVFRTWSSPRIEFFFIRNSKWKSICVWLLINFPIDRPSVQRDQRAPVASQECSIRIPGHIPLQCGEQLSALSTGSGEQRVEGHVIRYIYLYIIWIYW